MSAVNLKDIPLYIISFFDVAAFKYIISIYGFVIPIRICSAVFLLGFLLTDILWASYRYGCMHSLAFFSSEYFSAIMAWIFF